MKKTIFSLLLASLCCTSACGSDDNGPETPPPPSTDPSEQPPTPSGPEDVTAFVRGADISWYTEMKADGKNFYNKAGEARECPVLMKEIDRKSVV